MQKTIVSVAGALSCVASAAVLAAPGDMDVKVLAPSSVALDYANAKPMPMPRAVVAPAGRIAAQAMSTRSARSPGFVAGKPGDGVPSPVSLFSAGARRAPSQDGGVEPEQAGTSDHVFTTSRANIESMKLAKGYPFTAVGRLFFNIGASTYVCSASLIKTGVVVTAAHCVSSFGTNTYYTNFQFIPDYSSGRAPFGVWTAASAVAPKKYLKGTDNCAVAGIVCEDDVALLILNKQGANYPGTSTGWLSYGWDGTGFNATDLAMITQLGYPVGLDNGEVMQRNDSEGYVDPSYVNNTVIGSMMNGGSSGGPWAINWGVAPVSNGLGVVPPHNVVVGVTSWGYTDPNIKEQGAAPFLSTNIVPLVDTACAQVPAACAGGN